MPDPPAFGLEAYLARIGCARPLAPSIDALRVLHQAHVGAIPFENLDILLGRTIRVDLEGVQAKLVAGRRGGYCFEQNALFRAALEGLGFVVTALAARVRSNATAVRPRTHMLLRVELPEGSFLADVGFGGDGPLHPLALLPAQEVWVGVAGHRLRREGDLWVLEGNATGEWTDLYAFSLEPQYPVDFEMANHFTSTWPESPFVNNLIAQRSWPEGRVILRNRDLVLHEGRAAWPQEIRDPDHLLEVLEKHFRLSFQSGTRFSLPLF